MDGDDRAQAGGRVAQEVDLLVAACVRGEVEGGHGRGQPFVQRSSQPRTSWYQRTEFAGFSTQWFSSGKTSSRDGTPAAAAR